MNAMPSLRRQCPFGLVAVDGPDERRWQPEGGLSIEHWPYLKLCCGPAKDEDVAQVCRDETISALLENELQKRGYSFAVATCAVDSLARQIRESGVDRSGQLSSRQV